MAEIREISLDLLKIHPKNVRKEYDGIDELAQSIKENGIMQNLTVVPDPEEQGKYLVVIGNRRLTAARKAGIETAPCAIVENMEDKEQILTMLTENMNRKDLKIYEESAGIQMCIKDFGIDTDTLVEKTGLSKTTIYHRINIAKLNQKTLQKKMEDKNMQLSISDLYALEKIKKPKTRDKVLKEATSSSNLQLLISRAVTDELLEENYKMLSELANKTGITPAPEKMMARYYGSDYQELERYWMNTEKMIPKKLKTKPQEGTYYGKSGCYFVIFKEKAKEKGKPQLSKEEQERKERDKKSKTIKATINDMKKDMLDSLELIINGSMEQTDDEMISGKIWRFLMMIGAHASEMSLIGAIGKKPYWDQSEEQKKASKEKAKTLPAKMQMLAVAVWEARGIETVSWDGTYNEERGLQLKKILDILGHYGYSVKEEWQSIVDGTSELYEKGRK